MTSKKQDFIRSEQNRDKHPERNQVGSAAAVQEQQAQAGARKATSRDRQEPHTPKASNDHNKMGGKDATQTNQGRRTPESRHDRQTMNGTMNVVEARTGGKGGGRGTRGGNVGGGPT
jgi:hypothetical protein